MSTTTSATFTDMAVTNFVELVTAMSNLKAARATYSLRMGCAEVNVEFADADAIASASYNVEDLAVKAYSYTVEYGEDEMRVYQAAADVMNRVPFNGCVTGTIEF